MTKVGTLISKYRHGGFDAVSKSIQDYVLRQPWGPTVKSLIGRQLHQKLLRYPDLGYWPQIKQPRTFNEKIMHRKLYTDDDRFAKVEDKWAVREYVAERVGEDILPRVYHVTDDPETIPFESLPDEYVVKPTHLSGPIIIVDEGDSPDEKLIKNECSGWLDRTHGVIAGEYWYNDIPPQILIEERLRDKMYDVPIDYKFFVFHGRVKAVHVTLNRHNNEKKTTRNFYNRDWQPIEVELFFERGEGISKPENFEQMVNTAESLGAGFDHIRVDLYSLNEERIIFGELTVAEGGGGNPFVPQKYDLRFGSYW